MRELEVVAVVPESYGWLETKLSELYMKKLWKYIDNAKIDKIDYRSKLAGNIGSSLSLTDTDNWFAENILIELCNMYLNQFPLASHHIVPYLGKDCPWKLEDLWVNFQKKHEFNPSHNHRGIFTFVVWMKIPTHYKEQKELSHVKGSAAPALSAGNFEFKYSTLLGDIEQYPYYMEPSYEGTMLFFPAKLHHEVYPFFECDEERISISGNIMLDIQ